MLQALIDACEQIGLREMVAVISDHGAEASIRLHEKLGFIEAGRMGRVGYKFGRDLGTVYMRRVLKPTGRRRGVCSARDADRRRPLEPAWDHRPGEPGITGIAARSFFV